MSAEGTSPPAYGPDGASSTNSVQQSIVDSKVRAVALFRSLFGANFHAQFSKLTMTFALPNVTRRLRCSQFSPKSSSHSECEGYGHQWWELSSFVWSCGHLHYRCRPGRRVH
jgi:hypothetical protein